MLRWSALPVLSRLVAFFLLEGFGYIVRCLPLSLSFLRMIRVIPARELSVGARSLEGRIVVFGLISTTDWCSRIEGCSCRSVSVSCWRVVVDVHARDRVCVRILFLSV
jgi:hypothetical protein